MANGPALSTARGGEVYVGSEIRDSLSLLDALHANQFEGENFDAEVTGKAEENFYRGAPPNWLNFHICEQSVSDGTGSPFVKRDGYEKLKEQIQKKRQLPGISTVKLSHQPGCGGTTTAMQVLWDLRKTFRCAVLTGSTSDVTKVAKEVVQLFTAGSRNNQNTVLLLVNNEKILEDLQDSIMMTVAEQKLVTHKPVVILLSCVRRNAALQSDHVFLQSKISDTEKEKFNKKKEELRRRYKDKCELFHGFNIMQSNFSQEYIKQACGALKNTKKRNKPRKTQLVAFLSLLNAYVPGSYLLESQCLDFLKHGKHKHLSLEDQMQPFSHLIIIFTFQQDGRSEKKVCMAHTMIAQCCIELMADAGVTRSDTAMKLLTNFYRVHDYLLGFVKDMLNKREIKKVESQIDEKDFKEKKAKFSRLILDITEMESKSQSVSVLKVASKKFDQNPFFPQALARFYYIELKHYNQAEMWAKRAMKRDPQNSFVADTLGQVYKNDLKNKEASAKPREILQLAKKAIEAFENEEKLAEDEQGPDMKEHGNTKVSPFFNNRGLFGYLQVCNILYDKLVDQHETWERVLTKKVSVGSVLESLDDNKLFRFNDLIVSLRDEVKRKYDFFQKYLTYSKPNMGKDDPEYISKDTSDCYRKYVGDSTTKQLIQMFKENLTDKYVEVLSFLVKEFTPSELNDISTKCPSTDSETALVNYILGTFRQKMPLSKEDAPELHMLALLLNWPVNKDKCVYDLSQLNQQICGSYESTYKRYFRSRYLLPLFFIGKGEDLNRIVPRRVIEIHGKPDWSYNWKKEEIFNNPDVQALLLRTDGMVRNYRVYATVGGKEIEMDANMRNSLWKTRQVTFYLGFTIRGPVAFGIQTKTADKGQCIVEHTGKTDQWRERDQSDN